MRQNIKEKYLGLLECDAVTLSRWWPTFRKTLECECKRAPQIPCPCSMKAKISIESSGPTIIATHRILRNSWFSLWQEP